MDRIAEPLRQMGALVAGRGERCLPPIEVDGGPLRGIEWAPPVASAQVKSCVLLAGLAASGETVVREAVATRAHTEELLAGAGAEISVERAGPGRVVRLRASALRPIELDVPGDPSQAAFWLVAGCLVPGSEVAVTHVYGGAERTGYLGVLARMGADVEQDVAARRHGRPGGPPRGALVGTEVAAAEIPSLDEVPVLAVAAAAAAGRTTFSDVGELRVKETDRLAAVGALVRAFGAGASVDGDDLRIDGVGPDRRLAHARTDSHGDHRMAMAAVVAALAAGPGESTVDGFASVATSYPGFTADLARAGRRRGGGAVNRRGPDRHRRAGRLGQVHRLAPPGRAAGARAARHRGHVPGRGLGGPRPGRRPGRRAGGGRHRPQCRDRPLGLGRPHRRGRRDRGHPHPRGQPGRLHGGRQPRPSGASWCGARRRWGETHGGGVVEGRDIGTVVFPDADVKVYLTAAPDERARRRQDEPASSVARRDRIDSTRAASPLLKAGDARLLDTTGRSVEDVVEEVLGWL